MESYQVLEQMLTKWIGEPQREVVVCSSGTAALHLALEALCLPLGSEVIIPDFTMVACARAVTMAGLVPVLVDCGDDLLMVPVLVEKAITPRTGAVMAVHVYGRRCDMEKIYDASRRHRQAGYPLYLIEDLAEAHGVAPHPETDVACWSFYQNKIIPGEEGGAAAFLNHSKAQVARELRCLGFTSSHDFTHRPRGHNYRLANCLADKIILSLSRYVELVKRRRQLENVYDTYCPTAWKMPPRDAPWVYDMRIEGMTKKKQDSVVMALQAWGIQARHGFMPMSKQVEYQDATKVLSGILPRSHRLSHEIIYLPLNCSTAKACESMGRLRALDRNDD